MVDAIPLEFRDVELDKELLSTPFGVQTKWHVITGAACSGKTTMIDMLAEQGFKTAEESGRKLISRELGKGRTIEEIREDQAGLTLQIYEMMLKSEEGLRVDEVVFLDRAIPDSPAFFRFAGLDPNSILMDCFKHRYATVFLLDRLSYQRDGVRVADDETAEYYEMWTLRDYEALGYEVVRVPVMLPEERLAFVLDRI